jgi:hypothetical protein
MTLGLIALLALPLQAQGQTTWLLAGRYSSASGAALISGRIGNRWAVVDELTTNTGQWALAVGAGPRFAGAYAGVLVLAGPADISGQWYAGLFVAPSTRLGRFSAGGTFEFFFPASTGAVFAYELSHARAFFALGPRLRVGTILQVVQVAGERPRTELGPSLSFQLGLGFRIVADAAFGLGGAPSQSILSLQWER